MMRMMMATPAAALIAKTASPLRRRPFVSALAASCTLMHAQQTPSLTTGRRSASTSASMQPATTTAATRADTDWLALRPSFKINASNVRVLHEPSDFFSTLLKGVAQAKRQITLASLYLGTGARERELIEALHLALSTRPELRVNILLDCMRGSRGENEKKSSRAMLLPLLERFGDRITLSLYHTPLLRSLKKKLIPAKFDETISVQHMKLYMWDDTILLSGANLSQDYFTNRQDRYMLFEDCPEVVGFFQKVSRVVEEHSYRVSSKNTLEARRFDPLACSIDEFGASMAAGMRAILAQAPQHSPAQRPASTEALVLPSIQLGCFGFKHDQAITSHILSSTPTDCAVWVASGYFNFPESYQQLVLGQSQGATKTEFKILTAAPLANGFFGARGIPGLVPAAYTSIERAFLRRVEALNAPDRVQLFEWMKPQWTFHAKGMWFYHASAPTPHMTLVGSSNFGIRSILRDIEAQVALVTDNGQLQQQLHVERERLFGASTRVTLASLNSQPERAVSTSVALTTQVIKTFF